MERRSLKLTSAQQVQDEIRRLREHGYQPLGKWNLSQICWHLNATMKGGMDGFGFRLPWILRKTLGNWFLKRALTKGTMPAGIRTHRLLKPTLPGGGEVPEWIDECLVTLDRASQFQGSMEDYPLADHVTVQQWQTLMWVHASHHLGFLIPNDARSD